MDIASINKKLLNYEKFTRLRNDARLKSIPIITRIKTNIKILFNIRPFLEVLCVRIIGRYTAIIAHIPRIEKTVVNASSKIFIRIPPWFLYCYYNNIN